MIDPSPMRSLPPVNSVLDREELTEALAKRGRGAVVLAVRTAIEEARSTLRSGRPTRTDAASLARRALEIGRGEDLPLGPIINATGILLNTGLGRAPLAREAAEAVSRVVRGYCNLEIELGSGDRGCRTSGVEALLRRLTGAEAAAVVNNNAAATVLTLRALAGDREVVVSRGQLIEIGGSFRLPEIFEMSGARLREVGTTNKTRLDDYARAVGPETAALLRVHPSNYRIIGFTEMVDIAQLASLAHDRGLWAIDDVGSGVLRRGMPADVGDEPTMAESFAAGVDIVLGSGDKLLGGPQCGLLVGKRAAIDRIKNDPMMRVVRVDKMTLAALETTLRLALDDPAAIPLWTLLSTPVEALCQRARRIVEKLTESGFLAKIEATGAMLGGGSSPDRPIRLRASGSPPYPSAVARLDESTALPAP